MELHAQATLREKLQDKKNEQERRMAMPAMAGEGREDVINESFVESLLTESIDLS